MKFSMEAEGCARGLSKSYYCFFIQRKKAKDVCSNYRKSVCESTDSVMEGTKCRISKEQGGFRKGRGSVDQIFVVRMTVEKYLVKGKKLYVAKWSKRMTA